MLLIITDDRRPDLLVSIHVPDDADLDLLSQMVTAEIQVPMDQQELYHDGKKIAANALISQNIRDGDIILCKRKQISARDIPNDISPEGLLDLVQRNPQLQEQIARSDRELAEALASRNVANVRLLLMGRMMARHKVEYEQKQEMNQIYSNPDSAESQAKIAEAIRQQNVQASMEVAMEEIPESFARVVMLYVDIEINGSPIKAFVDSGAQSTIMSVNCVERCNLMRLVDKRYAGIAKGVGTSKIIGRIHIAQMKIGKTFLPISITVLESNDIDFLFGLDTLRRHRCCIDLSSNMLRLSDGADQVPFLSEKDLPYNARGTTLEEAHGGGDETAMEDYADVKG